MNQICTVSDINYLTKGLTLYESLLKNTNNFVLHYLCIDDKTYNKIVRFESSTLKIYNLKDLLLNDESLNKLKTSQYNYFCWSLSSYFSNFLLHKLNKDITYIDSDIYFHQSLDIILDEIGDRDVGIFRHRQFPMESYRPEGLFNVGVVHFKCSDLGIKTSDWWKDSVLHKKHPEYATCGDQKYLDYFPILCPKESIYIDVNIGHGAPWMWQLYNFIDKDTIMWGDLKQKLIFTHFSQFEYDEKTYVPSTMHHIYTPLNMYKEIKELKEIYDEYYYNLKVTEKNTND